MDGEKQNEVKFFQTINQGPENNEVLTPIWVPYSIIIMRNQ